MVRLPSSDADTRGSLSQIKVPTLVIAGEEDRVMPPQESEILAKGISDSTLAYSRRRSFLDAR
jgi:pimeloyl-ACP methyl ester carboxylesterase